MNMEQVKELSNEEIVLICGGDKFMKDLGRLCGEIVRTIEDAWNTVVDNVVPGTTAII